ncbi:MAG: hypothetical protein WB425_09585 [Terracidiphilus sp.]
MIEDQRIEDTANENLTSSLQYVEQNMRLRQIRALVGPQFDTSQTTANDLQEEIIDVLTIYSFEVQHFDRLSDMLDKLPTRTEILKKQRDGFKIQLDDLGVEIQKQARVSQAVKKPTAIDHIVIIVALIKVEAFELDLIPFEEEVIRTVKNVKEVAQRLDMECTYTIWALYGFGWLLTFGGVISSFETKKVKRAAGAPLTKP